MGWFSRTFSNSNEARKERASLFLEKGRFNDARIELIDMDDAGAISMREKATTALVSMNLDEAVARFHSGDHAGGNDHLALAREFGATDGDIQEARKVGRRLKSEQNREVALKKKQLIDKKKAPSGSDPIWSLPPDDPRVRYAMRVESYPKDLRKRLVELGAGFAEAALEIEDGNPQRAFNLLSPFVEKDPIARFERAKAAMASRNAAVAISDLMIFGDEVGHAVIDNTHTGALLSQLLAQTGKSSEAMKIINKVQSSDDHPALALIKAQLLEGKGDLAQAEKECVALVKKMPNNMMLIRQLAGIMLKQNKRGEAASVLESALQRCCTPGKCSSQPLDVNAVRMLARIYLEDRVQEKRTQSLLMDLQKHSQKEEWEDQYLAALVARNDAQPFAENMAKQLIKRLSPNDPRREWVSQAFGV